MKPAHSNIVLTEDSLNYQENPLWMRIDQYAIDDANVVIPFSKKLAQTEKWMSGFTKDAIDEYKRFVYLCCISKNGASPSIVVDKVWHMHLLYTTEYWKEFCPNVLQRELHHFPNVGGIVDYDKHHDWYLETLILYIRVFKQNPPAKFWRIPAALKPYLYQELYAKETFKLSDIIIAAPVYYLLLAVPFIVTWLLFGQLPLLDLSMAQYHFLFILLILVINQVVRHNQRRHLRPVVKNLSQYDRYQLAYLSGGHQNAFLLLVSDLEENQWIRVRDGKDSFEVRYFELKVTQLKVAGSQNLMDSEKLIQALNQLPDKSKFNLVELRKTTKEYLNSIDTVELEPPKEDHLLLPVCLILMVMLFCCFPVNGVIGYTIFLDAILSIIILSMMLSWSSPVDSNVFFKKALKKQAAFLNDITTVNQQLIILEQYNGISGASFFRYLENFFKNKSTCGMAPAPPGSTCGC
ncbi:MAG: hypothetical protein JWR38_4355 [Mucilaginibacter sp.]|nr:hypothetical protein [Mucilaginibacter sp.]